MSDDEFARKLYEAYAPDHNFYTSGDDTRARWIIVAIRARRLLAEDQSDQDDAGRVTLWRMTLSAALVGRENSMTDAIVLANTAVEADKKKWSKQ